MAKQKSLFEWVKRLFTSESKDKKPKKWGWGLGRLKKKKQYPTITAPTRTLLEASAEQRKHALTVAIATVAAAEAAVAAAHADAEIVKLTSGSRSYSYLSKGDRSSAAIKIQSAYRAHLARKALRALKGVTRLQALIRGQGVRRQVSSTLNFPYNARNHMEKSSHTAEESYKNVNDQIKQFPKQKKLEEKELKHEGHSQRTWDCSFNSREDIESTWLKKQEAISKRERMKQYSFSQRERKFPPIVEESVHNKKHGNGREYRTLGQWLHRETCDWNMHNKQDLPLKLITMKKELQEEELSPQISVPRKSFSNVKRSPSGTESSLPNSPLFPTYMAVTESSKAKLRSLSTPRLRTRYIDTCSNQREPHKEDISFYYSSYGATRTNENSVGSQWRCQSIKSHSSHH